jgi:hypothetical protein
MKRADLRSRRARVRGGTPESKQAAPAGLVAKLAGAPSGLVELERVRTDGGTQPRASLDAATLAEYAERMVLDAAGGLVVDPEGRAWEEIVVFDDGESLWLADGFHRVEAARRAGLEGLQAQVKSGGVRDAIRYSLGVNATHGKRRTRADKRRALERALRDEEWAQWADARVARMCKVTQPFVTKVRAELEREGAVEFQPVLYGSDGRAFEREQAPSPAPTVKERAPRRARPAARAARPVLGFESLAQTEPAPLLVAYPVGASDWSALRDAADEVVGGAGALVTLVPAESAWTFAGPAMLDALVERERFARATLVHATSPGRTYAVWHRTGADVPHVVSDPSEIAAALGFAGAPTVVGQPLDRW